MLPAASNPRLLLALGATLAACGGDPPGARDGATGGDGPAAEAGAVWRSLFDGTSLTGWDRYLGKPSATEAPLGLENDPRGVYSIVTVDGAPAIRISGEIWGALISKETFCDFHLRAKYKWGTQIWPPLNYRDAGLMYLSTGELGAVNAGGPALSNPIGSGAFMVSIEYQITPTDVGAMAALGPIALTPLGRTVPTELPDDWNTVDIVMRDGGATHALGGVEVARGQGFVLEWPGTTPTALACGKLQLQSEGAEIFFRAVEIQAPP